MRFVLAVFLALSIPLAGAQEGTVPPFKISYTLDVTNPAEGVVGVEMLLEGNRAEEITLGIPVWAPGSYRIVPYYKAVTELTATAGGKAVAVSSGATTSLWKLKVGKAPKVLVKYDLKVANVPQLKSNLGKDHYELQGPSAYLFVLEQLKAACQVTFKVPEKWKIATGLTRVNETTYSARDYDTFIDCPTEIGTFELFSFVYEAVTYEIALHAGDKVDTDAMVALLKKIVAEHMKNFGPAPFDRYVFLLHMKNQFGYSGLEHLNSTHIAISLQDCKRDIGYLASVASHEFFHLWNVKRIRPKELGPFDYTQPVRSKALWLSEGCTSYFGERALVRANIWSEAVYFDHLALQIQLLQQNPARLTIPVEEASRTVWDFKMENPTPRVDYYNKGELLGLLLDLKMRTASKGKKSFDDVMRLLLKRYVTDEAKAGKGEIGVGFEEGGILKAVNEIAGEDYSEFFKKYVSGVDELPYESVFKGVGLVLTTQKSKALGVALSGNGMRVARVPVGSAPEAAGIKEGDRLTSVNGVKVTTRTAVMAELDKLKVGEKIKVGFQRGEEAIEVELPVVEKETGTYLLARQGDLTAQQKDVLSGWLNKTTY